MQVVLADDPEHFARGHDEPSFPRALEPSPYGSFGKDGYLLEVVEDHQTCPASRDRRPELRDRITLSEWDLEALGDRVD